MRNEKRNNWKGKIRKVTALAAAGLIFFSVCSPALSVSAENEGSTYEDRLSYEEVDSALDEAEDRETDPETSAIQDDRDISPDVDRDIPSGVNADSDSDSAAIAQENDSEQNGTQQSDEMSGGESVGTAASSASSEEDSSAQEDVAALTAVPASDHRLSAENGDYRVYVTYDDAAEIPEGTKIRLINYSEDDEEYRSAKEQVAEKASEDDPEFDEDTIGMRALDISLVKDAENEEKETKVQPKAPVQVTVEMKNLPEDAEEISVQHIHENSESEEGNHPEGNVATEDEEAESVNGSSDQNSSEDTVDTANEDESEQSTLYEEQSEHDTSAEGTANEERAAGTGFGLFRGIRRLLSRFLGVAQDDGQGENAGTTDHSAEAGKSNKTESSDQNHDGNTVIETVQTDVPVNNGSASAEFEVDGFSVFTITWTKGGSGDDKDTRVGTVNIHYVDEDGKELADPSPVPGADLLNKHAGDDGIVDLSAFTSKTIDNYTYKETRLADAKTGDVVTGLKVANIPTANGGTTYELQYANTTPTSSSIWQKVPANAVTGANTNSLDVYLVYEKAGKIDRVKITIHYMNLDGTAIKDENGKPITKVVYPDEWTNDDYGSSADDRKNGWVDLTRYMNDIGGYGAIGSINDKDKKINENSQTIIGPSKMLTNASQKIRDVVDKGKQSTGADDDPMYLTLPNNTTTNVLQNYGDIPSGYPIRFLRYENGKLEGGRGKRNNVERKRFTINGSPDVYLTLAPTSTSFSITVHQIDEAGNTVGKDAIVKISANDFTNKWNGYSDLKQSLFGYSQNYGTYQGAFIGERGDFANRESSPYWTEDGVLYRYNSSFKTWRTAKGKVNKTDYDLKLGSEIKTQAGDDRLCTEIWLVYDRRIRLHYIYPKLNNDKTVMRGSDGNPVYALFPENAVYDKNTNSMPSTVDVGPDADVVTYLNNTQTGGSIYAKDITVGGTTYHYSGSYLAVPNGQGLPSYSRLTTDAPYVRGVRLHNNAYQYLVTSGDGTVDLVMTRRNEWSYTTSGGRTLTLRKNGSSFSILDTQAGRNAYNLNLISSAEEGGNTINTYTGTSGSEGMGIEYTVEETISGGEEPTYKLTGYEWLNSAQTDIYQVYVEETGKPVVTVSNEVVYSGNLVARSVGLEGKSVVSYTWQKSINNGTWEDVQRRQEGNAWNMAHDLKDRNWLNLAADDGELSEKNHRNSVQYRIVMAYRDSSNPTATVQTTTSEAFSVPYWDQLINGSFENPVQSSDYPQVSQKNVPGWQTTGAKGNIEIARGINRGRGIYNWQDNTNIPDGQQWAELNGDSEGALYQDVVTHPNEYLNYWLSHMARTDDKSKTVYDTMYLVIMPTRLAMTSGSDGGELKEQADLEKFINEHGGFSSSSAGKNENVVQWKDTNSGVLVVRISTNNLNWQNISEMNGYVATAGLTRFFFAAGYTSAGGPTTGNFLDRVGFSQDLETPKSDEYHLVVTKRFSGLNRENIARMAENAVDENKQTIVNPFHLTIKEMNGAGNQVVSLSAISLGETELGFTADTSGNITLTARESGNDLIAQQKAFGSIDEDSDTGDVTMTWTLPYNKISGTLYYRIEETGEDLNGFSTSVSSMATLTHETADTAITTDPISKENGNVSSLITVQGGDSGRVDFTNVYRENTSDDPDHITVQVTFSGITPVAVSDLMESVPYQVKLKNLQQKEIVLCGNPEHPVVGAYPEGVQRVELTEQTNQTDGKSTYTWTITGTGDDKSWVTGNSYVIEETGHVPTGRTVKRISLNGADLSMEASKQWPSENPTVQVGLSNATREEGNIPALQTVTGSSIVADRAEDGLAYSKPLSENTNLIIGKYSIGENNNFLVWTPHVVGVNEKEEIISFAKDHFKIVGSDTDIRNMFHFRSGDNPGNIMVGTTGTSGTMSYNSNTRMLSFQDGAQFATDAVRWQSFFSGAYTLNPPEHATEIRIENVYAPAIRVQAVDKQRKDRTLQGATVRLAQAVDGNLRYYNGSNWVSTSTSGKEYTTDDSGINLDLPQNLVAGTYFLEGTESPAGYNRLTKPVAFKVNEDGTITAAESSGGKVEGIDADAVTPDWNSYYYTITLPYESGYVLPDTGGSGTKIFCFVGIIILCGAAFVVGIGRDRISGSGE